MARLLALRFGPDTGNHNQRIEILAGFIRPGLSGLSSYYCLDIEPEIS